MKCPRCLNEDPEYFYKGHRGYYCRKCIKFKRILIEEDLDNNDYSLGEVDADYKLKFKLTKFQQEASNQTLNYLLNGDDVLLHCVCGSGKTEIVVQSISYFLKHKMKVCYAVSRKEVVKELAYRYSSIFPNLKVVAVYGGHHDEIYGDLIVCTTHQLYRYYKCFDLLIIDEVDAFPLNHNDTLLNIAMNSCTKNIIYSTATVDDYLLHFLNPRTYKEVCLDIRPSLSPLIKPSVIYNIRPFLIIVLLKIISGCEGQYMIFVPSVKECIFLGKLLSLFFSLAYVYAGIDGQDELIKAFKNKEYQFLVTTTLLERGITINDVNVIVLNDIKNVFDKANLIQMIGRVGRNFSNPYGDAYILSNHKSKAIDECVKEIDRANNNYEMCILR